MRINLAVAVLESGDFHVHAHSYLHAIKESDAAYHELLVSYADKFDIELKDAQ